MACKSAKADRLQFGGNEQVEGVGLEEFTAYRGVCGHSRLV